jgi:hypothetical protein
MKEIDLSILLVDSIPARIYLALLNKHGYKLRKIVFIEIESRSFKYRVARRVLGSFLTKKIKKNIRNFFNKKNKEYDGLSKIFLHRNNLTCKEINECLEQYSDNKIDRVILTGLDDVNLVEYIKHSSERTFLFTGGGILKDSLLSIDGVKIIHIHPGIVPEVKGADCFFWSYLLKGRAGYSIFYMNSGIDTGDILFKKEFDLDFSTMNICHYKNEDIYHAILNFYDPCLRIMTFIKLLESACAELQLTINKVDMQKITHEAQNPDQGRVYFFMHRDLKDFVIDKLKGLN